MLQLLSASYQINLYLYYPEPGIDQQNNAVVSMKFQGNKEFANPVGVSIIYFLPLLRIEQTY